MNGEGNRYSTPFEDIIPIRHAEWCQRARAKAGAYLLVFLRELDYIAPPINQKECQGKKRYVSNADAGMAIRRRKKALQRTGDAVELIGLHPYKCTQCDGWHIGHRPGSADIIRKVKKERALR